MAKRHSFLSMTAGLLLVASQAWAQVSPAESKKVVIFYSTIGMGHLSAARAIEQDIKAQAPGTEVVLKNIRDFMGSHYKERLDEKLYWFVVKKFPDFFDKKFRESMALGNAVNSLDHLPKSYNEAEMMKFIEAQKPTSILATHYGSAVALGNLKERGQLKDIPVGWLHTDYFTGFFPRISQRIEKTFLAMPQMKTTWEKSGVDTSRVTTTGMPINPALFEPLDREAFLKEKGLDPKIRTITLASGGEGVGDFPLIVQKLAQDVGGPLQIIAVCAKNEKHYETLTKMKENLPKDVNLMVHKMVPNTELLSYIKSSDLYITKSGGLSPTEGFAITRPIILLDVYGGHERDNANLFEKEGLAVVNRHQGDIGVDARNLFANPELQASMIEKQIEFRNSFNLKAIAEFALNGREMLPVQTFRFGAEYGEIAANGREALARLERDSPADVEIILSYGKSPDGNYTTKNGNPFGHLAVRIQDKVYTTNGMAVRGVEPRQTHITNLYDYLYSVERPYTNVELTDAFGSAYGRDNVSIRVKGVSKESLALMHAEIEKIEAEWRDAKIQWNAKAYNCADFVARILKAGGHNPEGAARMGEVDRSVKGSKITMPLDVFDTYRLYYENNPSYRSEIITYSTAPGSEAPYRTTRYPLSLYQMKRSLKHMLFKGIDEMEKRTGKRLAIYALDKKVVYENVNGLSKAQEAWNERLHQKQQATDFAKLQTIEAELESFRAAREADGRTALRLQDEITKALAELGESERELLLEGKADQIKNQLQARRAQDLLARIRAWDAQQQDFLNKKDQLIKAELDYFIKGMNFTLEKSLSAVKAAGNKARIKHFQEIYDRAQKYYDSYMQGREQYGQPKDGPLRTDPYRQYFVVAKEYLDQLNASAEGQSAEVRGFWMQLAQKSGRLYSMVWSFMKMTPRAVSLAFGIYMKNLTGPGEAPVIERMNNLFKTVARELKIDVKVENREILPKAGPLTDKTVYIVAPTHRHPIMDTIIMSNLGLEKSLLAMATTQIVPNASLAEKMTGVDSIITVGRRSNEPIEQILTQLGRKKSNTILIYPEGSVSAGLEETRPLREKFQTGLLRQLRENGYQVKLIPVTYKNSAQFAHEGTVNSVFRRFGNPQPLTLEATVHPALDDQALRLLESTGDGALNRFIRSVWLENMPHDSKHVYGLLRPSAAAQLFREKIGAELSPKSGTGARVQAIRCEAVFASGL